MKKIQYLLAFTIILISCEQKNNTINKEKNKILTKHNSSTQEEKLSSENINDNILNTYVNGNFIIQTQLDNPIKYHKNGIISDLSLITKETNTISDIYIDKTHRKSCSFSKDGKLKTIDYYSVVPYTEQYIDRKVIEGVIGKDGAYRFDESTSNGVVDFKQFFEITVNTHLSRYWPSSPFPTFFKEIYGVNL